MALDRRHRITFRITVQSSNPASLNAVIGTVAATGAPAVVITPYTYFGADDGDGACFGFWPIDIDETDVPKLDAGDPIPREHWGEDVYLVNDHGNVTCAHVTKQGKLRIYWECV